jgi:hypothetical protein
VRKSVIFKKKKRWNCNFVCVNSRKNIVVWSVSLLRHFFAVILLESHLSVGTVTFLECGTQGLEELEAILIVSILNVRNNLWLHVGKAKQFLKEYGTLLYNIHELFTFSWDFPPFHWNVTYFLQEKPFSYFVSKTVGIYATWTVYETGVLV